jgi:hypothetical protein
MALVICDLLQPARAQVCRRSLRQTSPGVRYRP